VEQGRAGLRVDPDLLAQVEGPGLDVPGEPALLPAAFQQAAVEDLQPGLGQLRIRPAETEGRQPADRFESRLGRDRRRHVHDVGLGEGLGVDRQHVRAPQVDRDLAEGDGHAPDRLPEADVVHAEAVALGRPPGGQAGLIAAEAEGRAVGPQEGARELLGAGGRRAHHGNGTAGIRGQEGHETGLRRDRGLHRSAGSFLQMIDRGAHIDGLGAGGRRQQKRGEHDERIQPRHAWFLRRTKVWVRARNLGKL
jgi:hypothetical protein